MDELLSPVTERFVEVTPSEFVTEISKLRQVEDSFHQWIAQQVEAELITPVLALRFTAGGLAELYGYHEHPAQNH